MAELRITSSGSIQAIIDQLRDLNAKFRGKVDDLRSEYTKLQSNWTGGASEEYQNTFHRQEPGFENFAVAIDEYIQALQEILEEYEQKEAMNTEVARS